MTNPDVEYRANVNITGLLCTVYAEASQELPSPLEMMHAEESSLQKVTASEVHDRSRSVKRVTRVELFRAGVRTQREPIQGRQCESRWGRVQAK